MRLYVVEIQAKAGDSGKEDHLCRWSLTAEGRSGRPDNPAKAVGETSPVAFLNFSEKNSEKPSIWAV